MKKTFLVFVLSLFAVAAFAATTFTTNYQFGKPADRDRNFGDIIRGNWDKADTQIKANEASVNSHVFNATGAHLATAISATSGANICTTQITVQAYLDCLDGLLDPASSGVVLTTGDQTVAGIKTFSTNPVFSTAGAGILNTAITGVISASSFGALDPLTTKGDLLVYGTDSIRIAVGTDGQVLVADSVATEGVSWENPNPRWRKFTFTFSDFSAGANSFSVSAVLLQINEGIDAVVVKHNTAFSGGTSTAYTVEVGQAANQDLYMKPFDTFQAIGATTRRISNVLDVPNFGTTTDIVVTATSTGDTLDNVTAGSVDVYIRTFLLP